MRLNKQTCQEIATTPLDLLLLLVDLWLRDRFSQSHLQVPAPQGNLAVMVDEAIEAVIGVVLHQKVLRLTSFQFGLDTAVVAPALGPYVTFRITFWLRVKTIAK